MIRLWPLLSILLRPALLGLIFIMFMLRKMSWAEARGRAGWMKFGARSKRRGEKHLWIHLSSVGEYLTARSLIRKLRAKDRSAFLLTYFNPDVRKSAEKDGCFDAIEFLPFEYAPAYRRLIAAYQPKRFIALETEIWPVLLSLLAARGTEAWLLNATMYDKEFASYRRLSFLFGAVIKSYTGICARGEADARRFLALGAPKSAVSVTGDLKYDLDLPKHDPAQLRRKYGIPSGMKVLTLGSLHAGEDKILIPLIAAHAKKHPDTFYVLAPRTLDLSLKLFKHAMLLGLPTVLRTDSKSATYPGRRALILDTLGELREVYAASDLAFVGGSLVPHGGHNILEPIACGVRTFSGPHVHHFKELFASFRKEVDLVEAKNLGAYLEGNFPAKKKSDNGKKRLLQLSGAADRILKRLAAKI